MIIPRLPQNEKGIIMLTVIMMTIMLSLVIIGFMSSSVSQVKSGQSVIDQMKAEHVAMGEFYRYNQRILEGNYTVPPNKDLDVGGKTFSISYVNAVGYTNPNSTDRLRIQVTYQ